MLVDLLVTIVLWIIVDKVVKASTGKGLLERLKDISSGQGPSRIAQNEMEKLAPAEVKLFKIFCQRSDMKGLDAFLLARTEMGFGFSDANVERHYEKFLSTSELPNYVESFLDKGREHLV